MVDNGADVARTAARFGVDVGEVRVDFARVRAHVKGAIAHIEPEDSPDTLRAAGVAVLAGRAELTGPGTARVGDRSVRFGSALIATGASPTVPPVPGLREAEPLTSETVWDVEELPARLVVLGGGAIGSELDQAFARLRSSVTLVEGADRILPGEDPVQDGVLVLEDGARLLFDRLAVAVGRRARTEGFGCAAAGDVSGHPQFTHVGRQPLAVLELDAGHPVPRPAGSGRVPHRCGPTRGRRRQPAAPAPPALRPSKAERSAVTTGMVSRIQAA